MPRIDMESNIIAPVPLQEIVYTDLSFKPCKQRFDLIIAQIRETGKTMYVVAGSASLLKLSQTLIFHKPRVQREVSHLD